MASLNTPSSARLTTSNITGAAPPTKSKKSKKSKTSKTSPDPLLMSCECCWGKVKTLRKHYPSCPGLNGDWKFWASPYYRTHVFYDRKVFINHIRSVKADTILIESTPREYVTPRTWTTQFPEQAMKRQLRNILDEYFKINSDFAAKWKALNDDDMSPNLNDITDIRGVLKRCSEILCKPRKGDVQRSPIDQLKDLFLIDTEDVTEITTQDVPLSKKRKCSVPYNALDSIASPDQPKVKVADSGFTGVQFTQHQQDQIGEQDHTRHVSMGGVVQSGSQWSASGSSDASPTSDTSNAPFALEHQTQSTHWDPDETPNGPAGVHFGASTNFTDGTGYSQQTLQQGQNAYASPNPDLIADPDADVDMNALHAWCGDGDHSEYLLQNLLQFRQAPNARQNTAFNVSNDFGTVNRWNTSFPRHMQPQQTFSQMPNEQVYPNASAGNGFDNFNDWDLLQMPNAQVYPNASAGDGCDYFNNWDPPQMPNAHVYTNASAGNGFAPFNNLNSTFMRQHSQPLQQLQIANTTTNNNLGTFNAMNSGAFPPYAHPTAPGYEYPQYMNPASHDYRGA